MHSHTIMWNTLASVAEFITSYSQHFLPFTIFIGFALWVWNILWWENAKLFSGNKCQLLWETVVNISISHKWKKRALNHKYLPLDDRGTCAEGAIGFSSGSSCCSCPTEGSMRHVMEEQQLETSVRHFFSLHFGPDEVMKPRTLCGACFPVKHDILCFIISAELLHLNWNADKSSSLQLFPPPPPQRRYL